MISKIHVFTQIRQVRGAQYWYQGHCVSFARNVAKVYFLSQIVFSFCFSLRIFISPCPLPFFGF